MEGLGLLDRARAAGLRVSADGDMLVIRGPRSADGLARELLEHKGEILALLRYHQMGPSGDGQPPPLGRPPRSREELARLVDWLADPPAFATWLKRLMQQVDPAESDCERN